MRTFVIAVCSVFLIAAVWGKTGDQWKSRIIYQILTDRFAKDSDDSSPCSDLSDYCGGTFRGIIRKLDYIQGLGVNAIWISPIPEQTDKGYHGYWQKNIQNINPHFGTADDLLELVNECHSRDIWVMLDVVGNHMGNQQYGHWTDFSFFVPFDQQQYYHPYCLIENFHNQTEVEVCRLADLPDLDQSNRFVRTTLTQWVESTISKYGFDGIRVDSTPEVPKYFWSKYSQSAGVFSIGEVFNGDPDYVSGYQGPLDATLNYPMYYKLKDAFQSQFGSMQSIHDGVEQNSVFHDVSVLGNFLDNHDNKRFLNNKGDTRALKNALAYLIFAEGIPIIYYGTEQGFHGSNDPQDRESLWPYYNTNSDLYKFISVLANFRTQQGSSLYESPQIQRYLDNQVLAFTRGNVFVVTTNYGLVPLTRTFTNHPYSDGTELVNIFDQSDVVTVNKGMFDVTLDGSLPKIYHPSSEDVDLDLQLGQQAHRLSSGAVAGIVLSVITLAIVVGVVFIIAGIIKWRSKRTLYTPITVS